MKPRIEIAVILKTHSIQDAGKRVQIPARIDFPANVRSSGEKEDGNSQVTI